MNTHPERGGLLSRRLACPYRTRPGNAACCKRPSVSTKLQTEACVSGAHWQAAALPSHWDRSSQVSADFGIGCSCGLLPPKHPSNTLLPWSWLSQRSPQSEITPLASVHPATEGRMHWVGVQQRFVSANNKLTIYCYQFLQGCFNSFGGSSSHKPRCCRVCLSVMQGWQSFHYSWYHISPTRDQMYVCVRCEWHKSHVN